MRPDASPTDAFTAKLAELDARDAHDRARRAMWLAHHWPEHYDRCAMIAGRHVCRRCLWLYPLTLAVAVAGHGGLLLWPRSFDPAAIWLVSIPGTVEFVVEQLGFVRYRAARQSLATVLVALALGRGMSYELAHRWSAEFWGPLVVFGTIWFAAAAIGHRRGAGRVGGAQ